MSTKVDKFIKDTHTQYNVPYALTTERVRKIRYKLAAADISDSVSPEDETLAQNIILADYNKSSSNMKTAGVFGGTTPSATTQRNAGTCPRCSQGMVFAQLASQYEASYCNNCHVCIPVK